MIRSSREDAVFPKPPLLSLFAWCGTDFLCFGSLQSVHICTSLPASLLIGAAWWISTTASRAFLLPFATDSELRKQYLQGAKSPGNCALEKCSELASAGLLRAESSTMTDPISCHTAQGLGTCSYFLTWALRGLTVDGCS